MKITAKVPVADKQKANDLAGLVGYDVGDIHTFKDSYGHSANGEAPATHLICYLEVSPITYAKIKNTDLGNMEMLDGHLSLEDLGLQPLSEEVL